MTLETGTRLGPYDIVAPLGAGGMGEVFRARDRRIGREVAIKILPEDAVTADRVARFEREVRTVGSLSHPGLLVLHDLGEHEGRPYLVSELLEGETLRERIAHGAVPWRQAAQWTAEIAHGLGAAHHVGIVHRDLKPENLFLTRDGRIKILDFGLAKLSPFAGLEVDAEAPTATLEMATREGVIVGTAGYMSPEQVRGEDPDSRSDVFALGAVLFELLTGRRAFPGNDPASVLGAVLDREPELRAIPDEAPEDLVAVVVRCLAKDRQSRFQSADDLAFHLESIGGVALRSAGGVRGEPAARSPWRRAAAALALVAVGAAIGFVVPRADAPTDAVPAAPPALMPLTASGGDSMPSVAPDGSTVAFVSARDGTDRIWLARTNGSVERPLTEGPHDTFPRFSPSGEEVLFLRDGDLYRIPVLGGESRRVFDDVVSAGWLGPEEILMVRRGEDRGSWQLERVRLDGGHREVVHRLRGRTYGGGTATSPEGRRVAFAPQSPGANILRPEIAVVDLVTGDERRYPTPSGGVVFGGAWIPDGTGVVYSQSENLSPIGERYRLVKLDLETGTNTVLVRAPLHLGIVDVDDSGRIYVGARFQRSTMVEVGLESGGSERRTLHQSGGFSRQPVYSPDGGRLAFTGSRGGNVDLWSLDLSTREVRRLTDDPGIDWDPAFLPDGRLLWTSDRSGNFEIWVAEPDGSDPGQLTSDGYNAENPTATSGGWVVYNSSHPDRAGVWRIRADGTEAQRLVAGLTGLPDASPADEVALYLLPEPPRSSVIRVVGLEGGRDRGFGITARSAASSLTLVAGRARWLRDGSGIVYLGRRPDGAFGLMMAPYREGAGQVEGRVLVERPLGTVESFGISPDGAKLTAAVIEFTQTVSILEGVRVGVATPEE